MAAQKRHQVDHWLGGDPGNGRAADVHHVEHVIAACFHDRGAGCRERPRPTGIVRQEDDPWLRHLAVDPTPQEE
jgi:hypothetical protein